jgi:hypothetical protein
MAGNKKLFLHPSFEDDDDDDDENDSSSSNHVQVLLPQRFFIPASISNERERTVGAHALT